MKTSTLILSIGGGAGVLGGGSFLASHLLSDTKSTKLIDELNKKGHTFLDFEDDKDLPTWKIISKAYSNGSNKFENLSIVAISGSHEATPEQAKELRNICKDLVNSSKYEPKTLISAEQWCVKPITVKDLINKHRKVLDFDTTNDNDSDKWEEKVTAYLQTGATQKIARVTLSARTDNKANDRKTLRTGCKTLSEKQTHDKDFHDNYAQFEKWCTINK